MIAANPETNIWLWKVFPALLLFLCFVFSNLWHFFTWKFVFVHTSCYAYDNANQNVYTVRTHFRSWMLFSLLFKKLIYALNVLNYNVIVILPTTSWMTGLHSTIWGSFWKSTTRRAMRIGNSFLRNWALFWNLKRKLSQVFNFLWKNRNNKLSPNITWSLEYTSPGHSYNLGMKLMLEI